MDDRAKRAGKLGGVESVDRALSILRCFSERDASLSLTEIATRTDLYKSTILRLTTSLERSALLVRLPDKSFRLGPELMRLGAIYQRSFRLEDHVRPVLRRLLKATGESASFFRREGNRRVCLFREDSKHTIRDHIREGDQLALDKGSAGHVLVRFDPETVGAGQLRRLGLKLPLFSFGERDPDTAAGSVPVFSSDRGRPVLIGALTVSGPRTRFNEAALPLLREQLLANGRALSEALGGGYFWGQ